MAEVHKKLFLKEAQAYVTLMNSTFCSQERFRENKTGTCFEAESRRLSRSEVIYLNYTLLTIRIRKWSPHQGEYSVQKEQSCETIKQRQASEDVSSSEIIINFAKFPLEDFP